MEDVLYWAAGIVTVGGALALMLKWISAALRHGKKWDMFLDDWNGTPPRPGRPAVPGVMQRLVDLERGQDKITHEIFPNSGGSLRDVVDRLEEAQLKLELTSSSIPAQR